MKARINGIELEGTVDEIIAFKDAMDERECRHHFKITNMFVDRIPYGSDASEFANILRQKMKQTYATY